VASRTDIANAALLKLAQDIPIAALTERTKAGILLNRIFDPMLELVLSAHAWPFALTSVALAELAQDPLPGWAYRYSYPSDCVNALALTDEGGIRGTTTSIAQQWCEERAYQWRDGRCAFEVVHGDQDTSIAADLEDAYLIYVTRVTNASRYPIGFQEALACRLALEAAPVLKGDLGLREAPRLRENYLMALAEAKAHSFNESRETRETVTPSVAARG
jgi:hypothetical protein